MKEIRILLRRKLALRRPKSAIANARTRIDAAEADVERTGLERKRQEVLLATEPASRQKVEQAVAHEQRFSRGTHEPRG